MIHNFSKKYAPLLVYSAVFLLAISDSGVQILILTTLGEHSRILRQIAIWLLFIKILSTRYTKKEFFLLLPVAIISLYNYTLCGNNYCIWNVLLIASLKDIDYSKLFKTLFYGSFGALLFVGCLSFLGIGGAVSLTEDFGRGMIETRYCFGMYHPNIWHFTVARCIVFFILGYQTESNGKVLLALFMLNLIAYKLSISRTGFMAITAFILLIAAYKYLPRLMNSALLKILLGSGCLGAYLAYSHFMVDYLRTWNPFAGWISQKFTNGRLTQVSFYLKENPIKLWGTRFPDDGTLLDCGFFRMLFEAGWILGGIFIIAFLMLLYRSLKNNWYPITSVCIFIALYGLYEVYPFTRPTYNIVIFFIPLLISLSNSYSENYQYTKISSGS